MKFIKTVIAIGLFTASFVSICAADELGQAKKMIMREYQGKPWDKLIEAWMTMDYYSAPFNKGIRVLLDKVELYHLGPVVGDRLRDGRGYFYVYGDLAYSLRVFPNHPQALQLMITLGQLLGIDSLAMPWFQKALRVFPYRAVTHAQFGSYLGSIGESDAGIAELEIATEMDENLTMAYLGLAKLYTRKKQFELAKVAAEKARLLSHPGKINP